MRHSFGRKAAERTVLGSLAEALQLHELRNRTELAEELGIRVLAPTVGKELHDDNAPGTQRHDGKDAEDHDGRDIGLQHHLYKRDGIVQKNLLRKNSGRKHTPRAQCSKNI